MRYRIRKSLLGSVTTLSFGLLCASSVSAQSTSELKIYGIADAGIEINDSGVSGPSRTTKMSTGNMAANRLGFIGGEDLGGGYKATFNLELGYNLDAGDVVTLGIANGLFSRRSVVGLSTPYGSFDFGRDYTPGFWTVIGYDRFGYGLPGTVSTASQINEARTSNGIFYRSHDFGGFYARLAYAFGAENAAAPRDLGHFWGGSVNYKNGPLSGSVIYQERKDLVPGTTTRTSTFKEGGAGVNYDFTPFAVNAAYYMTDPLDGAVDSVAKTRAYWVGGSYVPAPASLVYFQVAKTTFDFVGPRGSGRGITYGLAYNYSMSRRTTLYAGYGGVNNHNARLALSTGSARVGGTVFGASPKALVIGMRHTF